MMSVLSRASRWDFGESTPGTCTKFQDTYSCPPLWPELIGHTRTSWRKDRQDVENTERGAIREREHKSSSTPL